MSYLSLSFLGSPQIECNGRIIDIELRKGVALLAYLAITADVHSRDALATLFWPESDQKRAKGSLRYLLSMLRKILGQEWLITDRQGVALNNSTDIRIDVVQLRQMLAQFPPDLELIQDQEQITALANTANLYRGQFLAGLTLEDCTDFDDWQRFETEDLHQKMMRVLELLTRSYNHQQMFDEAILYARRWLALSPWHEPAHYQLMKLFLQTDQRVSALQQYETCVDLLNSEFGIQPSKQITSLYEQIRSDIPQPQPKPKRSQAAERWHNLPLQHTRFIDREQERADIGKKLDDPYCRLVTLVGQGGVGKTRLSIQSILEHGIRLTHDICYVNLTPLTSPSFLPSAIANSLDISFQGTKSPESQLVDHLHKKSMLLVLDNFEHLLAGADFVETILTGTKQVKVLVTSREPLNLREEHVYGLEGLSIPVHAPSEQTRDAAAIQLFVERAQQVNHNFSLLAELEGVTRICQLVEGLPLGIELAATWVKFLSCDEIALEIQKNLDFLTTSYRNIGQRHRSLRAVFEHSWQLLSAEEQSLLSILSVFRGEFTREAAIYVSNASLFTMLGLVNKSLLRRVHNGRYVLHELLSQFATEKLSEQAKMEACKQHAAYYGQFVQKQEALWDGDKEHEAISNIRAEILNIRRGWHYTLKYGDEATINFYIEGLYDFYAAVNWYREGQETFQLASTVLNNEWLSQDTLLLVRLLSRQAEFHYELGNLETALYLLQESQLKLQDIAASEENSFVYKLLGTICYHQGKYDLAKYNLHQCIKITIKDQDRLANAYLLLGAISYALGDYEGANDWQQQSLKLYQELGKNWGIAHAFRHLGMITQVMRQYDQATNYYEQALHLFEALRNPTGTVLCMNGLGIVSQNLLDFEEAKKWYKRSLWICEKHDLQTLLAQTFNHLSNISHLLGQYTEAQIYLKSGLQTAVSIHATPIVLKSLLMAATLLTETNTISSVNQVVVSNKTQQAYKLATFVLHHPASNQETRQDARQLQQNLVKQLSKNVVQKLAEDIRTNTLNSFVARFLPENAIKSINQDYST